VTAHDDFNSLVRRASERAQPFERRPPTRLRVGDLGVGRGGTAGPPPRRPGTAPINDAIRAAARIVRHAQLRNGVDLADLAHADLWRTRT
jgi:hypothetical protein